MKIIFKKDYTSRKYMIVQIQLETSGINLEKKGRVTYIQSWHYMVSIN